MGSLSRRVIYNGTVAQERPGDRVAVVTVAGRGLGRALGLASDVPEYVTGQVVWMESGGLSHVHP